MRGKARVPKVGPLMAASQLQVKISHILAAGLTERVWSNPVNRFIIE